MRSILSECGLSPFDVENIVMVIRSFPIRVSGESGKLPNEIDWNTLREESGRTEDLIEYTSCTNRVRRVARFDADVAVRSIICNKPNIIVLNHLDYVDYNIYELDAVSEQCEVFISKVEKEIGQKITYFGTGPSTLFCR